MVFSELSGFPNPAKIRGVKSADEIRKGPDVLADYETSIAIAATGGMCRKRSRRSPTSQRNFPPIRYGIAVSAN